MNPLPRGTSYNQQKKINYISRPDSLYISANLIKLGTKVHDAIVSMSDSAKWI